MITQEEVLDKLAIEGLSSSKRTLGYWRGEGLLPPLEREGQQYYWKEEVLDQVRTLCSKKEREVLITFELEGREFEIERVELKRINGSPKRIIYLSDGTFMVTRAREEAVYAVTKI
tara:strand:- start:165 stop:512 length:348 start_codon:yes stop_codon:yes gene_type:complete